MTRPRWHVSFNATEVLGTFPTKRAATEYLQHELEKAYGLWCEEIYQRGYIGKRPEDLLSIGKTHEDL